jgi:hypothetical protein
MPFVSRKGKLKIWGEKKMLWECARSRTEKKPRAERAGVLLLYYAGKTISEIARSIHTNRPEVERCVKKALQFGVDTALEDLPRKGKPAEIGMDARSWFLSVACMKPKDLGFASEL